MTTQTWSQFAPLSPKMAKMAKMLKNPKMQIIHFVRRRFKLRMRGFKLQISGFKLRIRSTLFILFSDLGKILNFGIFQLQWTISSEQASRGSLRNGRALHTL